MHEIKNLKPSLIWQYFVEILSIPRPSKKEDKILSYLIGFAKKYGLKTRQDKAGNILITKQAYQGFENKEILILQSHVDMVCEKNEGVKFDFLTDPINAYIEEGWIKARGTTLGADNGIGIAAQLAILADETIKHGPLECLFTVDEETGLTGAFNLQTDFLKGKYLINLDSEDDGELFIGCSGGIDTLISIPIEFEQNKDDHISYRVKISGLLGGHSGDDIHKGRGNANKLIVSFLITGIERFNIGIVEIKGGNLRNAIPREAYAVISLNSSLQEEFLLYTDVFRNTISLELANIEPELKFTYEQNPNPLKIISPDISKKILYALHSCPNGVIEMSSAIKDLVETSSNLASIRTNGTIINIVTSQRSSVESSKQEIANRIRDCFELIDGKVTHTDPYPGWMPNTDSTILKLTEKEYIRLFNEKPLVRAIHAGLECGLFLEKYPYLDMVSFGPTIKGAHSPTERLEIKTVSKFWNLLLAVIEKMPEK